MVKERQKEFEKKDLISKLEEAGLYKATNPQEVQIVDYMIKEGLHASEIEGYSADYGKENFEVIQKLLALGFTLQNINRNLIVAYGPLVEPSFVPLNADNLKKGATAWAMLINLVDNEGLDEETYLHQGVLQLLVLYNNLFEKIKTASVEEQKKFIEQVQKHHDTIMNTAVGRELASDYELSEEEEIKGAQELKNNQEKYRQMFITQLQQNMPSISW